MIEGWPKGGAVADGSYARALGARLRTVRRQRCLSLHGVERESDGKWKAVVVGSYERGDRAVSVRRLAELAAFYGVAVSDLLPRDEGASSGAVSSGSRSRIVLDVGKVAALTDANTDALKRYVLSIQRQRGALGRRTLDVRQEDLHALALIYDSTTAALTHRLLRWQVLAPNSLPASVNIA